MCARRMAAVLLAGAMLTGCASQPAGPARSSGSADSSPAETAPTGSSPAKTGGAVTARPSPGCGSVPVSSGPAAPLAELRLSAASTAVSGADVAVRTTLHVVADGQRIITGPSMSQLLVTAHGVVVGKSQAGQPDVAVPLVLRAGADRLVQVLPATVRMSGCAGGTGGDARSPLPAGEYGIVAVLGYRQDPLNSGVDRRPGGGQFYLVSQAATITVH